MLNNVSFAGNLGQTYNSNSTLTHYHLDPLNGQTLLYLGDLSYADNYLFHDNVSREVGIPGEGSQREVLLISLGFGLIGNHEVDLAPRLVTKHLINQSYIYI